MQGIVGISDCDHVAMEEEEAVFSAAGLRIELHQCKTEDDLIEQMQEYEVIGNQYAPITRRVLEHLPKLKCVVRYGVGINHIDLKAAADLGVAVCNVPDYGVQEVASHAVALMMALTRKIVPMTDSVRRGEWSYEYSIPIKRYSEMTFGVIGVGRIGKRFAHIVHGLDGRILACDPLYGGEGRHRALPDYIELTDLDTLLRSSDVVSVHTPLESSTDLLNAEKLALMKKSAVLINVSRGGIVNERDLADALNHHVIAAAACDVLTQEPPQPDHPLLHCENFLCTPHMAWYSEESSSDLKRKLAEEMVRAVRGEPLRGRVN